MKKAIYSLCALCMALAIVLIPVSTLDAFALNADAEPMEEKVFCSVTLEDDFAEDEVVVTIKNKESLKFKKYVASDFVDIGCESVDDLSIAYADDVRIHKDHACKKSAFAKDYNQLLSLKLKEKSKENVLAAIKVLEKRDDVLSAEPSYILDSFDSNVEENNGHGIEPNKAIGGGLPINPVLPVVKPTKLPNDPGRSRQWAIARIKLPEAWNYTTGSSDVVVGVIDSGVDSTHPDLQGKIDTSLSYDFVNNTSAMPATSSLFYHGTMVAGIIAAQTDNGEGIAGAGWNVRIASLRVGDSLGGIKTPYVVSAIEYARIKGIPIINLSLGGKQDDSRLRSAIEKYTGVIVCAAGNAEADNDDSKNAVYPASYSYRENLISVGASDTEDKRFINGGTGSNYGKTTVDLFAPGANIYSTMIQGRYQGSCSGTSYYESDSGTSYAAPYVGCCRIVAFKISGTYCCGN